MIQLFHVYKRYPNGTDALVDLTLRVREGEFVFLTGPSGAGKSTLLRLLLVMERATEGQILIGGRNIHVLQEKSIPFLRRNIGIVFQDFRLIRTRTVFENIAISLEIMGMSGKEINRRVNQLLDGLRLNHRAGAYPGDLSAGEQQRVAIARALVNEPAILLADEPTGNLDPELGQEILQLLIEISRRGTTVIVATHDHGHIDRHGMRTLVLTRGQLSEDRPRQAVAAVRSSAVVPQSPVRATTPLPVTSAPNSEQDDDEVREVLDDTEELS
ncbi:MAG: cell division ATP-binding protein FtsE [Myxococcales bacterium]|nr:cell division ATP-binding protein FtsE [Myxococcales bacterium]